VNPTMPPIPLSTVVSGATDVPVPVAVSRWASVLGVIKRLGRDSTFILVALPAALLSFTVLVTGLSLAAALLVTVIGVPVAVATLAAGTGFASLERWRLGVRGTPLEPRRRPVRGRHGQGLRGMLRVLSDGGRWAEVLHGISILPLAIITWSVVITWWVGALGGLTFWFWAHWLPQTSPDSTSTLPQLLHLPVSVSLINFVLGVVLAATLVPVVRGCANLHAVWARLLLTRSSRRVLQERVNDLTVRRSAAASAEAQALRRFERDIHDGPQQRLVRLGMDLSGVERRLGDDPAAARELLAQARTQAAEALAELRELSRGIAPPILADRGLEAALAAIVARSLAPTTLDVELGKGPRPTAVIENAAYYVVCETLTNIAKHAAASSAAVRVSRVPGTAGSRVLRVEVQDDGVGGADLAKGHGLAGLLDRVTGLDGTLSLESPVGGPTMLVAELPC
jgi:signal transduction histidine kinase